MIPTLTMTGMGREKPCVLGDITEALTTQGVGLTLFVVTKNNKFPFHLSQTNSKFFVASKNISTSEQTLNPGLPAAFSGLRSLVRVLLEIGS